MSLNTSSIISQIWRSKLKVLLAILLVAVTMAGVDWATPIVARKSSILDVNAAIRERATGSTWGYLFSDPGFPWFPHYGVGFRGSYGADPNYIGPGGNAATNSYDGGIKAWHWWGNELGSLLTPKSWVCWPNFCSDRTTPGNYNAIVTR